MKRSIVVFLAVLALVVGLATEAKAGGSLSRKPSVGLTVFGLTAGNPGANKFFSVEVSFGVNAVPDVAWEKPMKPFGRFVPAIEFESFDIIDRGAGFILERNERLFWLKGTIELRPERKVMPYVGIAVGVGIESAITRNDVRAFRYEATGAVTSTDPIFNILTGVRAYPHHRIALNVAAQVYRRAVSLGVGYVF